MFGPRAEEGFSVLEGAVAWTSELADAEVIELCGQTCALRPDCLALCSGSVACAMRFGRLFSPSVSQFLHQ